MLRIAEESDVPAILDIYGPYIVTSTATFEYTVPSREEFLERFHSITARFPWLVYEDAGVILGYAYASAPFSRAAYQWCAEPTVYLRPEARGRGIARSLYAVLEEILIRQGYQVLYALVCEENKASMRFHEKQDYHIAARFPGIGFKMGRWLSLIWFEKRLEMVKTPSIAPCSWSEIVHNAESLNDILDSLSIS